MMKGSSSVKELEEQVILATHRARQVEDVMIVVKHRAGELEGQMVQLKEQIQSMHQDFNKKHDDLLARFDSLSTQLRQMTTVPFQVQHDPEMWIDVVTICDDSGWKSRAHRVSVNSSDTIDAVKMKIYLTNRIPPDQQKLVCAGQVLYGDKTLADYNIESGSTIHLMLNVRLC